MKQLSGKLREPSWRTDTGTCTDVAVDFSGLRIRLLGGLQLSLHGTQVKFAAPVKVAALLAYLILNRSRNMLRDATAFALWPDEAEGKAPR